jgi:AICAR transformylase/IMP cyclohydrolase PurH
MLNDSCALTRNHRLCSFLAGSRWYSPRAPKTVERFSEGVRAICQPGGSVNDYDAIAACNDADAAMLFTMERCFSHH